MRVMMKYSWVLLSMMLCRIALADAPTTQPDLSRPIVLADGTGVQIMGITKMPEQDKWWDAAGNQIDAPCDPRDANDAKEYSNAAVILITPPPSGDEVASRLTIKGASSWVTTSPMRDHHVIQDMQIMCWKLDAKSKSP